MTGDKSDPAEMLARARRAWSPGAADAARVRRALGAALDAGPSSDGGAAPDHRRGSTSTPGWTSRFLVAIVIAAASGGAGYWAGHRAGLRDARPATSVLSLERPKMTGPNPESARAPSAVAETPPLPIPSLVPSRHDTRITRRGPEVQTPSQTESLVIEVRALRNAERALRDANPGLALAFLRELDRQVPKGQLGEERDAADTLARCTRGDHPFGVNLGAEFAERHPGSVYRARVEQACGETDSPASGDSPPRRSER
jgi:hypothetical protein